MEKKEKPDLPQEVQPLQDDEDLDFINENLDEPVNKLNISKHEKNDLEELDDEKIEQEFNAFLQDMQKQNGFENDFFNQMNKMFENPDLQGNILGDLNDDANMDNFANKFIFQMVNKDIIYEPLKEAKKQYDDYLATNKDKITKEDEEKIELLKQSI